MANDGAIPVDHGGHGTGDGPGAAILLQICFAKSVWASTLYQSLRRRLPIIEAQEGFGQPGNLKKAYVPATEALFPTAHQVLKHDGWVRNIENDQPFE